MQNKKIEDLLLAVILDLTLAFQIEFPSIYDNSLKTPLFLNYNHSEISETELEAYYEFLQTDTKYYRVRGQLKGS